MNAASADHLIAASDEGIEALANSDTVACLLPGTSFFLKDRYTKILKILQQKDSFTLDDVGQEHKRALAYLAIKNVIQKA